jgi:hypothetical protein
MHCPCPMVRTNSEVSSIQAAEGGQASIVGRKLLLERHMHMMCLSLSYCCSCCRPKWPVVAWCQQPVSLYCAHTQHLQLCCMHVFPLLLPQACMASRCPLYTTCQLVSHIHT